MHTVGIKSLKDKLSEYIRLAASGETVLVTDRGRVVAELIAPRLDVSAGSIRTDEQIFADLVRRGLATPARHRLTEPPHIPTEFLADYVPGQVQRELDTDREDR